MSEWDSFYRAFAPGGHLATGQPAFASVYSDPVASSVGAPPSSRAVQSVAVDAYGNPIPQQTAAQAVNSVAEPDGYSVVKAYDDRLAPQGPLAYSGVPAANPNPFGLPPVPYAQPAAPAPVAAPPQGVAGFFGNSGVARAPSPVPAVVAAHAAPATALSTLASMFAPSAPASAPAPVSPELQRVRDIVSGQTGNTYASAGNNNASARAQQSPGGSLSTRA